MERSEIEFALEALGNTETVFQYFKDRYAVMLLAYAVSESPKSLSVIKNSPLSGLLRKEILKPTLASSADGLLDAARLAAIWDPAPLTYILSLGSWPKRITKAKIHRWHASYNQTSRPGYNIVLHLNFPYEHERFYKTLIPDERDCPFQHHSHPHEKTRRTLAWARIDFDLTTGEALIEEIQSDWIRLAYSMATTLEVLQTSEGGALRVRQRQAQRGAIALGGRQAALDRYLKKGLEKHREIWAEAMLAATIQFIVGTLGLKRIYYHTNETGARMKGIHWRRPPRSLYSQLPKRFCFERTTRAPEFLVRGARGERRKVLERGTEWFWLEVG